MKKDDPKEGGNDEEELRHSLESGGICCHGSIERNVSNVKQNKPHISGRGFSLIEMVLVLALIGIITALIAPGLVNNFTSVRLKTSAQKTVAIITYTRNQAVFKKKFVWLLFDRKMNRVAVIDPTGEGKAVNISSAAASDAFSPSTKAYFYPEDVLIEKLVIGGKEVSDPQGVFIFYPNGSSSGGEIGLRAKNARSYCITIDPLMSTAKVLVNGKETG